MSFPKAATPALKPVLFVHFEVDDGVPIYSDSTGSLTTVKINEGYIKSIDPEFPFDAKVNFGWDDIRSEPKTATNTLDCRVYLTSAKGKGVFIHYSGVVHFEGAVLEILQSKRKHMEFDDGFVTCSPDIVKVDSGADEEWAKNEKLTGKGRFLRNDNGGLVVEYYIYKF